MPTITVYTKPHCPQCSGTKRWLDRRGVDYDTVDVSQDVQALEAIRELGYAAAPVVFVSPAAGLDVHWSGLRPDLLAEHTGVAA